MRFASDVNRRPLRSQVSSVRQFRVLELGIAGRKGKVAVLVVKVTPCTLEIRRHVPSGETSIANRVSRRRGWMRSDGRKGQHLQQYSARLQPARRLHSAHTTQVFELEPGGGLVLCVGQKSSEGEEVSYSYQSSKAIRLHVIDASSLLRLVKSASRRSRSRAGRHPSSPWFSSVCTYIQVVV
jgi:hypothetical protein